MGISSALALNHAAATLANPSVNSIFFINNKSSQVHHRSPQASNFIPQLLNRILQAKNLFSHDLHALRFARFFLVRPLACFTSLSLFLFFFRFNFNDFLLLHWDFHTKLASSIELTHTKFKYIVSCLFPVIFLALWAS